MGYLWKENGVVELEEWLSGVGDQQLNDQFDSVLKVLEALELALKSTDFSRAKVLPLGGLSRAWEDVPEVEQVLISLVGENIGVQQFVGSFNRTVLHEHDEVVDVVHVDISSIFIEQVAKGKSVFELGYWWKLTLSWSWCQSS